MDKPCVGPLLFAPACIAVCLAAFGLAFGPARYHIQLGGASSSVRGCIKPNSSSASCMESAILFSSARAWRLSAVSQSIACPITSWSTLPRRAIRSRMVIGCTFFPGYAKEYTKERPFPAAPASPGVTSEVTVLLPAQKKKGRAAPKKALPRPEQLAEVGYRLPQNRVRTALPLLFLFLTAARHRVQFAVGKLVHRGTEHTQQFQGNLLIQFDAVLFSEFSKLFCRLTLNR